MENKRFLTANDVAEYMGSEKGIEMKCWTREEYLKFSEYMMDDPVGYYYFQISILSAVSFSRIE